MSNAESSASSSSADAELDALQRTTLFAGIGAWALGLAALVLAVAVFSAGAGDGSDSVTTSSLGPTPSEGGGSGETPVDELPVDEPTGPVVPPDYEAAGLGINTCYVAECAASLQSTPTPLSARLDSPSGIATFSILFRNTSRADEDGSGNGYFLSDVTIDNTSFTYLQNESDCPGATDFVPLPAGADYTCTIKVQGIPDNMYLGSADNKMEIGLRAELSMLEDGWAGGDPVSTPVTLRSIEVVVPG